MVAALAGRPMEMNYGHTIPQMVQLGELLMCGMEVATQTQDNTCQLWSVTQSTLVQTMQLSELKCGHTIPPITRHGSLMTSVPGTTVTALAVAIQEFGWKFSLVTPSTSQPMVEALDMSCGRMTPPIIRHGV